MNIFAVLKAKISGMRDSLVAALTQLNLMPADKNADEATLLKELSGFAIAARNGLVEARNTVTAALAKLGITPADNSPFNDLVGQLVTKAEAATAPKCDKHGTVLTCAQCEDEAGKGDGDEDEPEADAKLLGTTDKTRREVVGMLKSSRTEINDLKATTETRVTALVNERLVGLGHAPLPIGGTETPGVSRTNAIEQLREQLKNESNPAKRGTIARQLRDLREGKTAAKKQ